MTERRILLVDDEDDIRLVASASLRRVGGHDVTAVSSGAAALEALASAPAFDVVVLDVQMPAMDGRATLAAIRGGSTHPDVPVVFLTAQAQASERRELEDLAVTGVLAKPFDPMQLPHELAELMGWT